MFHLITTLEVNQTINLLEELSGLANPSEYTVREVREQVELLRSLTKIDTELVLELNRKVNEK